MAKHKQSNNLATAEITAKLGRLEALLGGDMSDIMRGIAGILEDDVEEAFENEWNPSTHEKWAHLDADTIKQRKAKGKWPGDILRVEGNLASRVTSDYGRKFSRVGVKSAGVDDYAPAMQFGRPDKNTPSRPYLPFDGLHPETAAEVLDFLDGKLAEILN